MAVVLDRNVLVSFDLSRTRFFLKQAFDRFTAVTETEGIYRSWAGIVDTYTFGLDEWHQLDEAIDCLRN